MPDPSQSKPTLPTEPHATEPYATTSDATSVPLGPGPTQPKPRPTPHQWHRVSSLEDRTSTALTKVAKNSCLAARSATTPSDLTPSGIHWRQLCGGSRAVASSRGAAGMVVPPAAPRLEHNFEQKSTDL